MFSTFLHFWEMAYGSFQARHIAQNRLTGLADDERSLGWDFEDDLDMERSGWANKVKSTIPHIEEDEMYLLQNLENEVREMLTTVKNGPDYGR